MLYPAELRGRFFDHSRTEELGKVRSRNAYNLLNNNTFNKFEASILYQLYSGFGLEANHPGG